MLTFLFSTDTFSSQHTSTFIVPALTYFFPALSYDDIDFWHIFLRKIGHISEYFVLAALAYRCFRYEEIDPLETRVKTIAFVLLAALLDEWHQHFIPSRGSSIVDVGYDCIGAVL